jgi:NAD(P)-dependent dehydrogenase (short-subunit alcohol dehydrogenase family)
MAGKLDGRVAVITGGTSGIGAATAELFASEGCAVIIAGRSVGKGEALAEQLGEKVVYCQADVMNEADIAATIDLAQTRFGKLDILFNNAGGPVGGTIETVTQQDLSDGIQLLLGSVVFGMKYAVPLMKANGGGSIINNSSIAGLRYRQGSLVYSAAKAAVTHYSKLAGVELGPSNIRVNCISPGAIATPIFWGGSARANTLSDEENAKKQAKLEANLAHATPLPSSGVAEDIAQAALYLAGDEGRYVNCHDLVVDGGRTHMFNEGS